MLFGRTGLIVIFALHSMSAFAGQRGGIEYSGSGFLTVGVGKMIGGTSAAVLDRNCPCFAADYAQGAVYDGSSGLQLGPDSKLGLQGTVKVVDSPISITSQVVSRGATNGKVDIGWLYGSYQISDNTVVQLGRKRLSMFYYSDIQDVGFALPWVHLPPQQYGWEAVNYNGINVLHKNRFGDWSATINVLAGSENVTDSGYWKIYNGQQSKASVKWNGIFGGDISLVKDWFEARFAYIQSDTSRTNTSGTWNSATQSFVAATDAFQLGNVTQQKIYSAAFNVDTNDWMIRSEVLFIDRPGAAFKDNAYLLGAGRRFGSYLLMATTSGYRSEAVVSAGGDPAGQEQHTSDSLVLRYDLDEASDIKFQFDNQKDRGGINWTPRYGDAQLLTAAYDKVF